MAASGGGRRQHALCPRCQRGEAGNRPCPPLSTWGLSSLFALNDVVVALTAVGLALPTLSLTFCGRAATTPDSVAAVRQRAGPASAQAPALRPSGGGDQADLKVARALLGLSHGLAPVRAAAAPSKHPRGAANV